MHVSGASCGQTRVAAGRGGSAAWRCCRVQALIALRAAGQDAAADNLGDAMMDLTFSPLSAERWPALEDLFGRAGASNGCWCMYWRIGPCYRDRPREDNKRDLEQLARSGQPPGLLAFEGHIAVGWCELAPRADLDWLARGRHFRPVDDLPVWSVPCFYVRRTHRRQGVMEALIEAATGVAASVGAPALGVSFRPAWLPQVVARRQPDRPVMRKVLGRLAVHDRSQDGGRAAGRSNDGFAMTVNLLSTRRANFTNPRSPPTPSISPKTGISKITAQGSHHLRLPPPDTAALSRRPSQYIQIA